MIRRSVPLCFLLSILTFGLFFFVWFYWISKEVINELEYSEIDSPALNLVFLILGNFFYLIWWNYKISSYLKIIEKKQKIRTDYWTTPLSIPYGNILHQSRINRILVNKYIINKRR